MYVCVIVRVTQCMYLPVCICESMVCMNMQVCRVVGVFVCDRVVHFCVWLSSAAICVCAFMGEGVSVW